ncbi:MAG: TIGR03960 family B12-binding radical SAM protein [Candidatus Omnitrophota bacterium]
MSEFDIVGFSLSYELTYTNVLDMLRAGGITVLSEKRSQEEPLVIAGGACCYNPEPMSRFIDVFIVGDGEESSLKFVDRYKKLKKKGLNRKELIKSFSGLEGVYVPALYEEKYCDNKFSGLEPVSEDVPCVIKKVSVKNFEESYYPAKQIVPFVKIIHDRMVVEIMRGCPNQCRFCQASSINYPVRIKTPGKIRKICRDTYKNTGYENIALLSLSSINYPYLKDVISGLNSDFKGEGVGVSIPSLRVDEAFYELPEMIAAIRKTGLTFALESADDGLRKSLGKKIDLQVFCKSAEMAFKHGWQRMKLYFMVGFPGEYEDEVDKIIEIAQKLSILRKRVASKSAEVKVSVNAFIPKPHTALQWLGMGDKESLLKIRRKLTASSSKKVKFEFHNIDQSIVEACLARGNRKISDVIYEAWLKGAKMDGWTEFFSFKIWEDAFEQNGINIYEYACGRYSLNDVLPWAHIKIERNEEYLRKEFKNSGF